VIRATFQTKPVRELCFDTESVPWAWWFGDKTTAKISAFGWKYAGQDDLYAMVMRQDGRFDTGGYRSQTVEFAYRSFARELAGATLVFGHNVRQHDLRLIEAGLMRLRLPSLPELRTTDTLRDIPRTKDMSRSLDNLTKRLRLEVEKMHLSVVDWEDSNNLDPDGSEIVKGRVTSDVVLQERLRDELDALGYLKPPRRWVP
jgi:hypothetical protein